MCGCEVRHMDVVANACAVRSWVVGPENVDFGALSDSSLACNLDKVCGPRRGLTSARLRISAGYVEVAQHDIVEAVCKSSIPEHNFRHQLRTPVGRNGQGRIVLRDRHPLGIAVDGGRG